MDLEAAFVNMTDVQTVVEDVFGAACEATGWRDRAADGVPSTTSAAKAKVPKLSFHDAMCQFGTDKPDVRFDMRIVDVSDAFCSEHDQEWLNQFPSGLDGQDGAVIAIRAPKLSMWSGAVAKLMVKDAPTISYGRACPARWGRVHVEQDGGVTLQGAGVRHVSQSTCTKLQNVLHAEHGDMLFLTVLPSKPETFADCSAVKAGLEQFGALRLMLADWLNRTGDLVRVHALTGHASRTVEPVWVTDFPLVSGTSDVTGGVKNVKWTHHPFTAPVKEDSRGFVDSLVGLLAGGSEADRAACMQALSRMRGAHYDFVVNGVEVGGGSMRIHNGHVQRMALRWLDMLAEEDASGEGGSGCTEAHLRHLCYQLSHGAPPHGGFAFGFDRLLAVLLGKDTVRDVIPFPKLSSGRDPLTGAPSSGMDP